MGDLAKRARESLARFCNGEQRMSVPARPGCDDDLVIASALDRLEELEATLEAAVASVLSPVTIISSSEVP